MSISLDPSTLSKGVNLKTGNPIKLSRVDRVKKDLNRIYTESETKVRASMYNLQYIDLYGFPIDTNHLIFLPKEDCQRLKMGVFSIRNKEVFLATPSLGHPGQKEYCQKLTQENWKPKIFMCSDLSFEKILQTYDYVVDVGVVDDGINLSQKSMKEAKGAELDLASLNKKLQTVSMSSFLETLLVAALESRSSDIHFEPEKETYNIRFRIDGVLQTVAQLPVTIIKAVESRLKIVSGLKLNVDNIPQDGRFSFNAEEKEIDVRVSMLPSNYGYSVVMRLLGTGQVLLNLDALGFTGLAKKRVLNAVNKPQGMILTTGPTGSGKTTTLYTILSHLNDGQSKIITLEDPIEYKLSGLSQTQIDIDAGYTFASGLKSILRQDPDIVMVGEIRDEDTAEVAVQASLTGHQVLSTIHTNDAAGSIPRILELGVEGFLLADSLSAVIGQRLIRRNCEFCKEPVALTDEQKELVNRELSKIPETAEVKIPEHIIFQKGKGCPKCNGLGYKGRVGAYEVLSVTNGLRELLSLEHISTVQVRQVAQSEGMITMLQDGIIKAMDGITTIEEVVENIA